MGKTNAKGEIGEAMILADLQRQGHGIAIPFGHDLPFDLIVVRKEDGALEKVQCKYTTSNGRVIFAKVTSTSAWVHHRYTRDEVDWIAVYDATTDQCFYLPSSPWDGQATSISVWLQRPMVKPSESDSLGTSRASSEIPVHLDQGTLSLYHWVLLPE